MSEQQSGAGYPQQPTSGQPQQQAYGQQPQYASPQAQYQAQQQYAGYAPAGPSLFERLGVPAMPAILGFSGLGALALSGLIAGTSDDTILASEVGDQFLGVLTPLAAVMVMFALTMFGGERLRGLWKALTLAAGALFLGRFLFEVLALPDSSSGSDASAWIGAILLLGAYAVFIAGALMVPASAEAAAQAQAAKARAQQQAQQQAQQAQQQAAQQQQPQQPGAYGAPQTQQNQWPQSPQG